MALSALVRRMTEAGVPADIIEEVEAMEMSLNARRVADRDRKRGQRERLKTNDVTGQSRDSHVTPPHTPPYKKPTLFAVSPTFEKEEPPQNISKDIQNTPPIDRKSAWQEGRAMPVEWLAWAQKNRRWTKAQVECEAERFIDSALANRRTYVDWFAAWRQWCRSPFQKTVGPSQQALTL